jgi:hypothetical protein
MFRVAWKPRRDVVVALPQVPAADEKFGNDLPTRPNPRGHVANAATDNFATASSDDGNYGACAFANWPCRRMQA